MMTNHTKSLDDHVAARHSEILKRIPDKQRFTAMPGDIHTHTVDAVHNYVRGYRTISAITKLDVIARWYLPERRLHAT